MTIDEISKQSMTQIKISKALRAAGIQLLQAESLAEKTAIKLYKKFQILSIDTVEASKVGSGSFYSMLGIWISAGGRKFEGNFHWSHNGRTQFMVLKLREIK